MEMTLFVGLIQADVALRKRGDSLILPVEIKA
jgi:hypothetical protein